MKSIRTIFILLFFISSAIYSQNEIPNASFENWTGGSPNSWYSTNTSQTNNITQQSEAHEGSSSLKGEIIEFFGIPYFPSVTANNGSIAQPFPISQNYTSLKGYYQYFPSMQGLNIGFTVLVDLSNESGAVAHGEFFFDGEIKSSWTEFEVELVYFANSGDATKATIQLTIGGDDDGRPPADFFGTYFLVDNLSFGGVTSVEQENEQVPSNYKLNQNYPNPFNPTTKINFSIPEQNNVKLNVYNLLGESVAILLNENLSPGNYTTNWNAENLSSGTYIYRLVSGNYIETRKMTLLK